MSGRRAARKALPDMKKKTQVTVRMTEEFAQDLNLVMATHKLDNVSYVVQQSVAAQADAIRARITERTTQGKPPYTTHNLVGQEVEGER